MQSDTIKSVLEDLNRVNKFSRTVGPYTTTIINLNITRAFASTINVL